MKPTKSAICVVSQNREQGKNLKVTIDSIGTYECINASSAQCVKRIAKDQEIIALLVDRSLDVAELKQLVRIAGSHAFATFGTLNSSSDWITRIESKACYRLRHPLARKDIKRLFDHLGNKTNSRTQRATSRSQHLYRGLVGDSAAIHELRELILKVAPSKSNVLITGETGTGKEIVARNIHYHSERGAGPFVPINCSAVPPELLESELFGHKKGAFTGATSNRDGRFIFAAGGTLFLDEIGDMSLALQVKLLRVLEERIIYRVGCNKPIPMTARIVAATHRNLEQSVEDGTFREDLYYRLNVVPIIVPSLRDRKEDISLLVVELSRRLQREQGISVNFTTAAVDRLQTHDWPGNVRELANLVERLGVILPNGTADVAELPARFRNSSGADADNFFVAQQVLNRNLAPQMIPEGGIDLKDYLRSTESALILQALNHCNGTMTQAATLLHVGRTTLTEKVKRLGLADFVKIAS